MAQLPHNFGFLLNISSAAVNSYARLQEKAKLQKLLTSLEQTASDAEAEAVVSVSADLNILAIIFLQCLQAAKLLNEATLFAVKTQQNDAALSIMVSMEGDRD